MKSTLRQDLPHSDGTQRRERKFIKLPGYVQSTPTLPRYMYVKPQNACADPDFPLQDLEAALAALLSSSLGILPRLLPKVASRSTMLAVITRACPPATVRSHNINNGANHELDQEKPRAANGAAEGE